MNMRLSVLTQRSFLATIAVTGMAAFSTPSLAGTLADRKAAVESVVDDTSGQCANVSGFYWEIGNQEGVLDSGRKGFLAPTQNTKMAIASAGKWLYGAYVVQARNGQLTQDDVYDLSMRGNYVHWSVCLLSGTVGACQSYSDNDTFTANPQYNFNYQGSQLQAHAVNRMNLGDATRTGLQEAMQSKLGADIDFTFNVPSPAAGMRTNAANYAIFLRKLLTGSLIMGNQLSANSTDAGAANIQTYQDQDGSTRQGASPPLDFLNEDWDYAPGHWIENDPDIGDGAFSSPGAFGFYPWIDASKTYYGVIARHKVSTDAFITSTECGRQMRDAWLNPEKYLSQ